MVSKKAKKIVLRCTESNQTNYVMTVSKDFAIKKLKKYCRQLKKRTRHKVIDKLK